MKAGETIFMEGDEGNLAYILQDGEVEVFKEIDGEEKILGTIGPGAIFGEMALIDSKPRMASARASAGCTIICVTRAMFDAKLKSADPFIRCS